MISNNYKTKKYSFLKLIRYFTILNLSLPHSFLGLTGFSIFVVIGLQVITGIFLATGYIPEPMLVPVSRETEDIEGCFIDDIFWLHERSVDILMLIIYCHILRKLYIGPMTLQTEHSWKTGVFIYLFLQVVIFFGIVLCSSQLSEITLRIAANIIASITRFWTELDWIIFTDRALNSDTLLRMTILHYLTGILLPFFGLIHGIEMHYDWKSETNYTGLKESVNWVDEGLINELIKFLITIWVFIFLSSLLFKSQEPISYEIFTWFDLGNLDVKYKGIAPHWYFRPYMGWLGTLPDHYGGLIILFLFHILFYYQPDLMGKDNKLNPFNSYFYKGQQDNSLIFKTLNQSISPQYNLIYNITFIFFTLSLWYVGSFLPYGLMFHSIGGNVGLVIADLYIFFYLLFPRLRGQYSYTLMLIEFLNILKLNNITSKVDITTSKVDITTSKVDITTSKVDITTSKVDNIKVILNNFFYIFKSKPKNYLNALRIRFVSFLSTTRYSDRIWYREKDINIRAYKKYRFKLTLWGLTKKPRDFIRMRVKALIYIIKKKLKLIINNKNFKLKNYKELFNLKFLLFIRSLPHSDKIWYREKDVNIRAHKKYSFKLALSGLTKKPRTFIRMRVKALIYIIKKKLKLIINNKNFKLKNYKELFNLKFLLFIRSLPHSDKIWYREKDVNIRAHKKYSFKLALSGLTKKPRTFIRMRVKALIYIIKKKLKLIINNKNFKLKNYKELFNLKFLLFIRSLPHSDKIWYREKDVNIRAHKKYSFKLALSGLTKKPRTFIRMRVKALIYIIKKKLKLIINNKNFKLKNYKELFNLKFLLFIRSLPHSDKIWYREKDVNIRAHKKYSFKLALSGLTKKPRTFIRMRVKALIYIIKKKLKLIINNKNFKFKNYKELFNLKFLLFIRSLPHSDKIWYREKDVNIRAHKKYSFKLALSGLTKKPRTFIRMRVKALIYIIKKKLKLIINNKNFKFKNYKELFNLKFLLFIRSLPHSDKIWYREKDVNIRAHKKYSFKLALSGLTKKPRTFIRMRVKALIYIIKKKLKFIIYNIKEKIKKFLKK